MENTELLTIGEKFGLCLDVSSALKTDCKAQLLHTLHKLIDVVEIAGLLTAP